MRLAVSWHPIFLGKNARISQLLVSHKKEKRASVMHAQMYTSKVAAAWRLSIDLRDSAQQRRCRLKFVIYTKVWQETAISTIADFGADPLT